MAFRRPLKTVNGQLYEMQDWEITAIAQRARYLYVESPSVTLSVVGSGGNLGTLYDTRLQAGAAKVFASSLPTEADTDEPSVVTVAYSRLSQNVETVDLGIYADDGRKYPVYYDGSNIRSMTLQDMYDTFIFSAINMGFKDVYYIHSDSALSGWSLQSSTQVFSDTGADTSAYTAAGIEETLDQPYTRANFYLFKRNVSVNASTPISAVPLYTNWNGEHIQEYSQSTLNDILLRLTRYVAANVPGYRVRYSWNGAGTDQGAAWDDRLNGSGNHQTRDLGGDDYRAQEFPDGSFYRVSTYYLRARTE